MQRVGPKTILLVLIAIGAGLSITLRVPAWLAEIFKPTCTIFSDNLTWPEVRNMEITEEKTFAQNSSDDQPRARSSRLAEEIQEESLLLPPLFQTEEDLLWERARGTLSAVLNEKFPELHLSPREVQRLARQMRAVQQGMHALHDIERTYENGRKIRILRDDLAWNVIQVQETLGMSIAQFIDRARDERAIDSSPEGLQDETAVMEYIRDFRP